MLPVVLYPQNSDSRLDKTNDPSELLVRGGRGSGERAIFEVSDDGGVVSFELGGFVYRKIV